MPLHITIEEGDRILIGDNVIIDCRRVGIKPQLSITAPREVKIQAVYLDPEKQLRIGKGADR